MKKNIKILFLVLLIPFLSSCTNIFSNPDVQTLNNKAMELMHNGNIKGAIARLESINDLNPNLPQVNYNLGVAFYKDGEYQNAIIALKKTISLDKNIANAYYTIGLAYNSMANKQINKFNKPAKNKKNQTVKTIEQKSLTKMEARAQIVDNLKNSQDYFTKYTNLIKNSAEKQRINEEVQSINDDIKKYEEEKTSS